MSNEKSTIGGNVIKYRNKLGISQDVLLKKADLAFHTIAKIEAGAPPKIERHENYISRRLHLPFYFDGRIILVKCKTS